MHEISEDEVTRMMGIGHFGEIRQGPDGNLYQYVQGIDGLGHPIGGFWSRVKRGLRTAVKLARPFASFVPGGTAALTVAAPFLRQAGVAGYDSLGSLYQAPDGSLYQMQGPAEEQHQELDEGDIEPMIGGGYLGEVRQGDDGMLYQWVEGVDGLGNPIGFWKTVTRWARKAVRYHPVNTALRAARPFVRKAVPIAQQATAVIPGGEAALTATSPLLKQAGVAGFDGLGAPSKAADGNLYPMQDLAGDEELLGLDDDEELRGFADDEDLGGPDDESDLRGLNEAEELAGTAVDGDLSGLEESPDRSGVDGYVRQDALHGLDAYVPQEPPQTRWHVRPAQEPDVWKPLW